MVTMQNYIFPTESPNFSYTFPTEFPIQFYIFRNEPYIKTTKSASPQEEALFVVFIYHLLYHLDNTWCHVLAFQAKEQYIGWNVGQGYALACHLSYSHLLAIHGEHL